MDVTVEATTYKKLIMFEMDFDVIIAVMDNDQKISAPTTTGRKQYGE